jgi:hypothetical protein
MGKTLEGDFLLIQKHATKIHDQQLFHLLRVVWLGVILLVSMPAAMAQQTIFNVPSADVTPKDHVYLEHESQFKPWRPNAFWLGTHYTALGVGHNTELDMTLGNVSAPASENILLDLGFKSNVLILPRKFPKRELKLTAGTIIPVSLQGKGVGNWSYAHLSGRIPKLNTRITAGVNAATTVFCGRDMVGFIGGYEQPITKRFSLIGDWFSGTHANGYFIPGFSYVITGPTTLFVGYQIPNTKRVGPQGFVIEISTLVPTRRKANEPEPATP